MINKQEVCQHGDWGRIGFHVFREDNQKLEAIVAIYCKKCGMFRTKILKFIREIDYDK